MTLYDPARFDSLTHGACRMISATILAAGESKRMGRPKMLLPWGNTTVLGHVISIFVKAGIEDIVVVLGGAHQQIENIVKQTGGRSIYNEDYAKGEMLSSLQRGIEAQSTQTRATLIGLGDQPQVQEETVRLICKTFEMEKSALIVPSFQMRRGHPWLVEKSLWPDLLRMKFPQSPRDFLHQHAMQIRYVEVKTSSVLADLDTPDDYEKSHP